MRTDFPKFTRIKGVSDQRRLPRLGKIRLGVKAVAKSGKEYPVEKDYFVVPPEVVAVYGDQPKELDVMLPVNDPEVVFPQRYIWYGASRGPKCIGDGEQAMRANVNGEFEPYACPCELLKRAECSQRAHLLIILPKVNLGGVYQIDLSGYHSIVDLNSGMDYVLSLVGRIALVPLKLRRVAKETHGSGRKETHYPLQIALNMTLDQLNAAREGGMKLLTGPSNIIDPPDVTNPAMDEGAVIEPSQKEEPFQVLDPQEEKFKAIIPQGTDRTRLDQFMKACAGYYKQTEAQVKESAITTPKEFFETYQKWEKKQAREKEIPCPDRGKIKATECESCKSRQGCPAL
jgi:hypothetical protein